MTLFLFIIGLMAIAFLYYHFYYKLRKLPPGPIPLPLIGNLLQINQYDSADQALLKWRRQYGPVFTYWLGNQPIVAIADYEKMVETVVKDADNYADRENLPFEIEFRGRDMLGVIAASGYRWREQRRFALHVLRDFGLGKNLMQERILDEISAMVTKLNAKIADGPAAEEVNLSEPIDIAVGSIINNLLFGYRLDGDQEAEFWEIKQLLNEHMRAFSNPLTLLWLFYNNKVLDHIPPFKQIGHGFGRRIDHLRDFFGRKIVEHQRELADNLQTDSGGEGEPKDYVEAFLREIGRKEASGEQGHYFNINQLTNMCFDLYIAGQETTSNMLAWSVACLLNYPDCLEKLASELDAVIGSDRLVNMTDKQSLPYTNAVVNETLRFANLLAMNVPRKLANDVCVDGFQLPKGTCVIPEIGAVLIDDTIFPEPRVFRPERFLDEQGKLKRCDQLVSFSLGKRQCLGEPLARMELFLFTANICNQYKLTSGKDLPSLKRHKGNLVKCPPFTCLIQKRNIIIAS